MDINKNFIIAAIIIIIIALIAWFLTKRTPEKLKRKRGKKSDESEADELYDLVHKKMVKGMSMSEFMKAAGGLADDATYISLKQLYKDSDNPKKIKPEDYEKMLSEMSDEI